MVNFRFAPWLPLEPPVSARPLEVVLRHELASGTFARIYCAEARSPGGVDRVVAVKVLRAQWNESPELVARTRDEARLLARLRHRSIVRVEHLGLLDGRLAIVMEFVDGLDLHQLIEALRAQNISLPARAALKIAGEVAAALDAAHHGVPFGLDKPLQVVHRDIKPQNIMVSADGEVKVLDFGTARSVQKQRAAQTHQIRFGSLKYMSPERREGDRGDLAGDVYSLGIVILELFANEWLPMLPLDAEEHDEAVRTWIDLHAGRGMPNEAWTRAFAELLSRMTAADASRRPPPADCMKLLRAFAEQAAPPDLDRFASEHVVPLISKLRPPERVGPLTGMMVRLEDAEGLRPSRPEHLTHMPERRTPLSIPPPAAPPADVVAAPPVWSAGAAKFAVPSEGASNRRPSLRVISTPREMRSAAAEALEPEPLEEPGEVRQRGLPWMLMLAVAAAIAALAALVSLLVSLWWVFAPPAPPVATEPVSTPPLTGPAATLADDPPVVVAPLDPPPVVAPPAVLTHFTVQVGPDPAQWVRLDDPVGQLAARGDGTLDVQVAPGTYTLSVKVIGRGAVRGRVMVTGQELTLACSEMRNGSMICTGGDSPTTLVP